MLQIITLICFFCTIATVYESFLLQIIILICFFCTIATVYESFLLQIIVLICFFCTITTVYESCLLQIIVLICFFCTIATVYKSFLLQIIVLICFFCTIATVYKSFLLQIIILICFFCTIATVYESFLLQIIVLICFFCTIATVYESLEYIMCYNEEKRVINRLKRLVAMAHRLALADSASNRQRAAEGNSETCQLLSPPETHKQTKVTQLDSWTSTFEPHSSCAISSRDTSQEEAMVETMQTSWEGLELVEYCQDGHDSYR